MIRRLMTALALGLVAATAQAETCDLSGGTVIPEIEELNQLVLHRDDVGFDAKVRASLGIKTELSLNSLFQAYPNGFDFCTTAIQRVDTGGMVQSIVVFEGKDGILFAYWQSFRQKGKFRLIEFNLNSDPDAIMSHLH